MLPEGCLCVVHARRRTVAEIAASIARQWRLPAQAEPGDGDGEPWTAQRLAEALSRSLAGLDGAGTPRLLVVDAVDEADRPDDLVAGVLFPLVTARREDGGPLCRVLAAGRDDAALRPLINAAAAAGGVIDLSAIPRRLLRPALAGYVRDLLGYGTTYERLEFASAADVLAEAIADALTAGPGSDTDPAPQRWGEFLVAGLYIRHVLDLPPVQALPQARQLGEAVPRDLRGVLALDLAWPGPGLDAQMLEAVARSLAFAEGSGMPERVAGRVAAAFSPSPGPPADVSGGETRLALDRLRFYLRRDIDLDGTTLHRLFHQGLADQLRADAGQAAAAAGGLSPAARVWQHLHAMVPIGAVGSRQWQHAEPYLLRHAAQHAHAGGRLEDLLQDAGFLTYTDPPVLAPLLATLPASAARGAADSYRASYATHSRQLPAARAEILAIDAARYANLDLAKNLASAAIWQPVWATSQSRSATLRLTLTGHTDLVSAVAVGRAGGREVIISGGRDGAVRVWDAATGEPVAAPPIRHTREVRAVAVGRAGCREVFVSGHDDGAVRVWDAVTGEQVGGLLTGPGAVTAVAVGRAGDREVIVSGNWDKTVRVWDAATGEPVGAPLTGHNWGVRAVRAVAVGRAGGREVIVSGDVDGAVRVWDAASVEPVGEPLTGHTGAVNAVAGGREVFVSGGQDRTVRIWDAATGEPVGGPATPARWRRWRWAGPAAVR